MPKPVRLMPLSFSLAQRCPSIEREVTVPLPVASESAVGAEDTRALLAKPTDSSELDA